MLTAAHSNRKSPSCISTAGQQSESQSSQCAACKQDVNVFVTMFLSQIGSYFGSELLSMDVDDDGRTDVLLVAAPMFYSQGWERGKVYMYSVTPQVHTHTHTHTWILYSNVVTAELIFSLQTSFILQGALEVSDSSQNARLGSALAQIPDMNGDGFRELVVGAPLEDDHQGAVYVFYGRDKTIQQPYRQVTDAEAGSQQDHTRTQVISVFLLFVPASVCRRLLCRSAVLRSKSSRRSGRQWRRAGRPRCGRAGSCCHHLVRPSHATF